MLKVFPISMRKFPGAKKAVPPSWQLPHSTQDDVTRPKMLL